MEITQKALVLEAAKSDNKTISNSASTSNDIFHVHQQQHQQRKHEHNGRSSSRSRSNSRKRGSNSSTKVNYHELGIELLCLRCGRANHLSKECRINKSNLKCKACGKVGHVKHVCIKDKLKQNRQKANSYTSNAVDIDTTTTTTDEDYGINEIIDIYNKQSFSSVDSHKFFTNVLIEGKSQSFEVDSGAGFTLIPENDFQKLNINKPVSKTNVVFRAYTGDIFKPLGVVNVNVKYRGTESSEDMYIVTKEHSALLGRVWIRHLKINLTEIDQPKNLEQILSINSITEIENKYKEIFQESVGCIPNVICNLKLQQGAKPVFLKARQVPFALREKVEQELDNMERDGIITKINTSNWGSPLVVIPKPDGNVRLCVDYKVAVNLQLQNAHYPIKKVDEIFNNLKNSKYFCKLDLFKAYLHVMVDEESSLIQAISTHRGTYKMNRLSFGIKSAPSEFNRIIDQILQGLDGTVSYFDDIVVHGLTLKECETRLINCLERLKKYQLHLNKNKCEYFKEEINYLGYVISHNKISKCPNKTQAIVNLPKPENADDIRRFLGMITYYSKFISNLSTLTFPLRQLLEKNKKFVWTNDCQKAFTDLKQEIVKDRVLAPFNPSLPVLLVCDASPTGIAAVLSHIMDGEERPVAFISRALTKAERNYSQLDREALAIIFAVDKFFMYLYGKEFTLITDNRPLSRIFHQSNKTPAMTSARLLRYATFLQGFNYKIEHRKSENIVNVDCLSRAPMLVTPTFEHFINEEVRIIQEQIVNQISTSSITATTIANETERDAELSKLKKDLLKGNNVDVDYSIQDGIVFKANRVMIPTKLREDILKELHHTHIGIVKMKQLARKYCYWKGIDNDIERVVRSCSNCAKIRNNPPKIPVHQWDEPSENFERVHIDYAGPFQNHYFLVMVDAKSKWPEIRLLREAPTSEKTIMLLQDIFFTHGFPQVIVSDNATIFQSATFANYCNNNGIIQKFIAPGHPATNGLAERYVQILKRKLKAMEEDSTPLTIKVKEILLRYRATPLANGETPSKLYLGRELKIKLDAIRPVQHKKSTVNSSIIRQIGVGDRVQVRWYQKNKSVWKFGTVKTKLGRLHYQVELDNGYVFKRHINQLLKSEVEGPKKSVSFAELPQPHKSKIDEVLIERRPANSIIPAQEHQQPADDQDDNVRRSSRIRRQPTRFEGHVLY